MIKLPYVSKSRNGFCSDRSGGIWFGYDLLLFCFDGKNWSQPQNLGPEIEFEFDEF